jgi:hypothetical protein
VTPREKFLFSENVARRFLMPLAPDFRVFFQNEKKTGTPHLNSAAISAGP